MDALPGGGSAGSDNEIFAAQTRSRCSQHLPCSSDTTVGKKGPLCDEGGDAFKLWGKQIRSTTTLKHAELNEEVVVWKRVGLDLTGKLVTIRGPTGLGPVTKFGHKFDDQFLWRRGISQIQLKHTGGKSLELIITMNSKAVKSWLLSTNTIK